MKTNRREFLKQVSAGAAGLALAGGAFASTAKGYSRIVGANDRLNVAIIGLGRRLEAYFEPVGMDKSNVRLLYLCDVMKKQRDKAAIAFKKHIDYNPALENDLRKVLDDQSVDALIIATPDHWHTPGAIMAMAAGKHVYVEKPCSHNLLENDMITAAQRKFGLTVQMGVQQRSSGHTIEIIGEIHKGIIGVPYKALTFYTNQRGEVPLQKAAPVPEGLDWELFQGPAPRRDYTSETWDYNWHWYGWDYGTAETGNNATHELDVARWALKVNFPEKVEVQAGKNQFIHDGWEMYDNMDATFHFGGNLTIKWDGNSRNGYQTYGYDRGTIIYGSEGSVFINRNLWILYDRAGKKKRQSASVSNESGIALGGGGDMSTAHLFNFFQTIRGKEQLTAPISDGVISQALVHYANIAYRAGKEFAVNPLTGKITDKKAARFQGREYAKGWNPQQYL
jgi:predicted dehydrogenase